ncbi:hypothetical protein OG473_39450 (plasmid) [Streptomyces anulatus]|uniref:hypothetical protein n=1 Tax=Streptomyces anulatus TaxID=1892 RepID=UPI0032515D5E
MTDTPMTPERERMIRIWHEELRRLTDPTAVARRETLGDLLAEVDRLRGELSDATAELAENARAMNALRRHRDTAEARIAELTVTPADKAAEMAEGAAELEAMRREHPAPCQVPDSPDCTCPLTPEQALRIERDRPESRTTHDCTLPLVRRLDCGHCPHEVCQDCDRCPHTCECASPEVTA